MSRVLDLHFPEDISDIILGFAEENFLIILIPCDEDEDEESYEPFAQVACNGNRSTIKSWLKKYEIKFDVDVAMEMENMGTDELLRKLHENVLDSKISEVIEKTKQELYGEPEDEDDEFLPQYCDRCIKNKWYMTFRSSSKIMEEANGVIDNIRHSKGVFTRVPNDGDLFKLCKDLIRVRRRYDSYDCYREIKETKKCEAIIQNGSHKGLKCGAAVSDNSISKYCGRHLRYGDDAEIRIKNSPQKND